MLPGPPLPATRGTTEHTLCFCPVSSASEKQVWAGVREEERVGACEEAREGRMNRQGKPSEKLWQERESKGRATDAEKSEDRNKERSERSNRGREVEGFRAYIVEPSRSRVNPP